MENILWGVTVMFLTAFGAAAFDFRLNQTPFVAAPDAGVEIPAGPGAVIVSVKT
jgi:hypothetical protein